MAFSMYLSNTISKPKAHIYSTHEIPGHRNEATLHDLHTKVCGPQVIILLNWTFLIEWYMAGFVIKNAHQKDSYVLERY